MPSSFSSQMCVDNLVLCLYFGSLNEVMWLLCLALNFKTSNSFKMQKFWKIQDICYQIGTEIFKIEEKMTEKMMPKVAYPPQQALRTRSCVLRIFSYS